MRVHNKFVKNILFYLSHIQIFRQTFQNKTNKNIYFFLNQS